MLFDKFFGAIFYWSHALADINHSCCIGHNLFLKRHYLQGNKLIFLTGPPTPGKSGPWINGN